MLYKNFWLQTSFLSILTITTPSWAIDRERFSHNDNHFSDIKIVTSPSVRPINSYKNLVVNMQESKELQSTLNELQAKSASKTYTTRGDFWDIILEDQKARFNFQDLDRVNADNFNETHVLKAIFKGFLRLLPSSENSNEYLNSINRLSDERADILWKLLIKEREKNPTFFTSFFALKGLTLSNNKLKSFVGSRTLNLESLDLSNNKLESFDGAEMSKLKGLTLSNNKLESFDPAGMTNLKVLKLTRNKLKIFVGTGLPNLISLEISYNQFENFDSSGMPSLDALYITGNKLTIERIKNVNTKKTGIVNLD